jgi:hypothetical protein
MTWLAKISLAKFAWIAALVVAGARLFDSYLSDSPVSIGGEFGVAWLVTLKAWWDATRREKQAPDRD